MLFTIPTFDTPYYDMSISFAGVPYVLRFRFNNRENSWRMSFQDAEQKPLVEGIKLLSGIDLLAPYHYNAALPPGALYVVTSGADDSPPGVDELGVGLRAVLIYDEDLYA